MRGEVIRVDGLSGDGLLSGDDAARYTFTAADVRGFSISLGDRVDFVPDQGAARELMLLSSGPRPVSRPGESPGYAFGRAMFSFNGRLRRSHFWISWGILIATIVVCWIIPILNVIMLILLLWPHLAIGVKRFHDMGRSGWMIAIPYSIMTVGWIATIVALGWAASQSGGIGGMESEVLGGVMAPSVVGIWIGWLIGIGFLVWLGVADSQRGANRFGPNPKTPGLSAADAFS